MYEDFCNLRMEIWPESSFVATGKVMGNPLRTKEGDIVLFEEEDNVEVPFFTSTLSSFPNTTVSPSFVFRALDKYLIENYPDQLEADEGTYPDGKVMCLDIVQELNKPTDKHKQEQEWYTELDCAKQK